MGWNLDRPASAQGRISTEAGSEFIKSSLFSYTNYRQYLFDYYTDQKKKKSGFTYARFAKKIGISSPNYYKLVMDGEKNLTPENVVRFSNGLDLDPTEGDFFETLVNFNQAKIDMEKTFYQKRLHKILLEKKRENDQLLSEEEFKSINHWLFHAIYVLSQTVSWSENPHEIKKHLLDFASIEDIQNATQTLRELGLIQDKNSSNQVMAEVKNPSFSIKTFYQSIFSRAQKLFSHTPLEEQALSSYVVGVSSDRIPELKERIKSFARELNDWALTSHSKGKIYNLTFIGFPLTGEVSLESKSFKPKNEECL